jgi:hypothetical protein
MAAPPARDTASDRQRPPYHRGSHGHYLVAKSNSHNHGYPQCAPRDSSRYDAGVPAPGVALDSTPRAAAITWPMRSTASGLSKTSCPASTSVRVPRGYCAASSSMTADTSATRRRQSSSPPVHSRCFYPTVNQLSSFESWVISVSMIQTSEVCYVRDIGIMLIFSIPHRTTGGCPMNRRRFALALALATVGTGAALGSCGLLAVDEAAARRRRRRRGGSDASASAAASMNGPSGAAASVSCGPGGSSQTTSTTSSVSCP